MANLAARTARETTAATTGRPGTNIATGRSRDRTAGSMFFLGTLWFSLFFGVMVLVVLIVDTFISGMPRLDANLLNNFESRIFPDATGFKAGIWGSIWLMITTAVLAVPLGIAAAIYLEEFADNGKWYNRVIEVNLQNLAAVPSIIYGLLAVGVMATVGVSKNIVLAGATALALLILPTIIITTREAIRAVPTDIRHGSYALGATVWQTTWRQTLPSAIPGIATGTILGLSRAIGEAAPLVVLGLPLFIRETPGGLTDTMTALPMQIYTLTSDSQEAYQTAASAAIIVLLALILAMNALAIFIRNKFARTW